AVDLLHFVDQVLRQRLLAEHAQNVVRIRRAVHERLARLHAVALADRQVLALRNQILFGLAHVGRDDDFALALRVLAERNHAVDLGNNCMLFRFPSFEQLGDARQTTGDVLGLGGFARDLGDDVARLDGVALGHGDVGADRQVIARLHLRTRDLLGLAVLVLDRDARTRIGVFGLDDDLARKTGDLVELLGHGHALDDVAELHDTADFGDDRHRERIPLGEQLTRRDARAFLDHQARAVHEPITLALAAGVVLHHDFAVAIHDHQVIALLDRLHVVEPHDALVAGFERALLGAHLADAADVERAHRQLRAGLADRLGRDDADGLADVHDITTRQVAAVAHDANAAPRLTRENRPDLDAIDARVLDDPDLLLGDFLVCRDQHLARVGIDDVLERDTAQDAVAQLLDDLAAFDERGHLDAFHGSAVEVRDDRVLRHVDQTPRQVARVGRLERRVGQTLAGAVR